MNLTPQFFFTADTHFGHEAMVHFCSRPKDFEELIVKNWNNTVRKTDCILHLGDISLESKTNTMETCHRLNGMKYLIRGNHDSGSVSWYKDCGFIVVESIYKLFKDKYGHFMPVLFTHEPVMDLPKGWYNIHGHLHGNSHRGTTPNSEFYFDAGVDANNFTPIALYDILNTFKKETLYAKGR